MSSHYAVNEGRPRRHDLVSVTREGWLTLLDSRADLAADPMIALWVDTGWPLIARRAARDDIAGVPVGLPLPPRAGKRRLSFVVPPQNIVDIAPPPALSSLIAVAPWSWRATLDRLVSLATHESVDLRVYGSLMWQAITGLQYLTVGSDLDVLLRVNQDTDLGKLTAGVAQIDATAPMRIDGELIRADGAGVTWREFHGQSSAVLVKMPGGAVLLEPREFLTQPARAMRFTAESPS